MVRLQRLGALALAFSLSACVKVYAPPESKPAPQGGGASAAAAAAAKKPDGPFKPWADVLKDTRAIDGYFKTHLKRDNTLFMEVLPEQLGKDFGMVLHYSRGVGVFNVIDGLPLSDMQLMQFRRNGDKVYLVHLNPRFTAPAGSPLKNSLDDNVGHSVTAAFKIESENEETKALLIDMSGFVVSDYPSLGNFLKNFYGQRPVMLDKDRSYVGKVAGFPKNVEIDAELTFRAPEDGPTSSGSWAGVSDTRSIPIGVRYSMIALPDVPMQPRLADDRVGHFMDAVRDFSKMEAQSQYLRYVNRWRLEKKDPMAAKSEPVQPIVYYIDRSVPVEYRKYVKQGIEAWNKGFEKAGFINAIVAKEAPDDSTWSAEDARYSTVRWSAAHQMGYAIGPSQTDPRTGEILNADVLISSTFVTGWNQEYQDLIGPEGMLTRFTEAENLMRSMPGNLAERFCMAELGKSHQIGLAQTALAGLGLIDGTAAMPEEFLGNAIRDLIMHEVGHTLGMRHNFKSSSGIPYDRINDKEFTRENGVALSVMDYNAVNISVDPAKQGYFVNPELGAYDVWAIQYSYSPVYEQSPDAPFAYSGTLATTPEAELVGLSKIASQAADPMHAYNTDEDTHLGPMALDPTSNTWDLSSDPMRFAADRAALVAKIQPRIEARLIESGEGYQRLRTAVNGLLYERFASLLPVTKNLGGIYFSRDHKGDPQARAPFTPVSAAKQRQALKFIVDQAFVEDAFVVPAELLNKMPPNRFSDWSVPYSTNSTIDFPIHNTVGSLQGALLGQLLDNGRLNRMVDNTVRMPNGQEAFTIAEMFSTLTGAVWSELGSSPRAARNVDSFRRNLQRSYIDELASKALNLKPFPWMQDAPEDARSLARYELSQLSTRIGQAMQSAGNLDETTRAHLLESQARIDRVLEASVGVPAL